MAFFPDYMSDWILYMDLFRVLEADTRGVLASIVKLMGLVDGDVVSFTSVPNILDKYV